MYSDVSSALVSAGRVGVGVGVCTDVCTDVRINMCRDMCPAVCTDRRASVVIAY